MPRVFLAGLVACAALATAGSGATQSSGERTWTRADDTRRIAFPATPEGDQVLAVDTHTHTVFSDGVVWPSVRVWEAEQDHLAAYGVTDHLEHHPYGADVATGDHNRPYAIAAREAARIGARTKVIPGVEITRNAPWGHFNALFLKDVNALPVDATMTQDPRPTLKAARAQGAFVIWNHPWALPGLDPAAPDPMPTEQRGLLADGLLDAVEIANSSQYSAVAFDLALKHGLAVVGASDVHTLVDTDLQIPAGQHRTATLVLATDDSPSAIREALLQKRTAALFRQTLYGRERELSDIVRGALRLTSKKQVLSFMTKDIVEFELRNDASIPFRLRLTSASPLTSPRIFDVPARGSVSIQIANIAERDKFVLDLEVLNAFVDPQRNLEVTLR